MSKKRYSPLRHVKMNEIVYQNTNPFNYFDSLYVMEELYSDYMNVKEQLYAQEMGWTEEDEKRKKIVRKGVLTKLFK